MTEPIAPLCVICQKTPEEIGVYVVAARELLLTPTQYVQSEEGTYNPQNGHFLCDEDFIDEEVRLGHRLVGPHGTNWVAP